MLRLKLLMSHVNRNTDLEMLFSDLVKITNIWLVLYKYVSKEFGFFFGICVTRIVYQIKITNCIKFNYSSHMSVINS